MRRSHHRLTLLAVASACLLLGGTCGGGGSKGKPSSCSGSCAQKALSAAQVETIVAQAVAEAQHGGTPATIAVVDRVGNVLAVFVMEGAPDTTKVGDREPPTEFDGRDVKAFFAAISKAGTGAYLSSQGNAFSTRTASQIIQQHFNPQELGKAGGPLFGVQFSQLPCGDFVQRAPGDELRGPKRLPLGLSGDPGGLPLYIDGVPVGGIGVEFDGIYGADLDILDEDVAPEERIATAGAAGFAAPSNRRADQISVDGRFLRFADDEAIQPVAPGPKTVPPGVGTLPPVPDFYPGGAYQPGALFLDPESGVVAMNMSGFPAEILVGAMGMMSRFGPFDSGTPPLGDGGLGAAEVGQLLTSALSVASRVRAQIRNPLGSAARVNIAIVDLDGTVLGFVRSPDAPVFGMDVSVQKARTAAFFSSLDAATRLSDAEFGDYVEDLRTFVGNPDALADGIAFSDRAGGNLSRPFFPDGIDGNANGPLSLPIDEWSPFNTGLQLDLVIDAVREVLAGENPVTCTPELPALKGGIQIFPGSVPIFRGEELVGGIGISGDGVDQDDLVAFLGLHEAGLALGGEINNADPAIRANTISVDGTHLRYVRCPSTPFLGSSSQNVCEGL